MKIDYDADNRYFNDMMGYKAGSKTSAVLGGQPALNPTDRRAKPCPTCGARPYHSCQRLVGGKTKGNPGGTTWYKRMKKMHDERGRDAGVPQ